MAATTQPEMVRSTATAIKEMLDEMFGVEAAAQLISEAKGGPIRIKNMYTGHVVCLHAFDPQEEEEEEKRRRRKDKQAKKKAARKSARLRAQTDEQKKKQQSVPVKID